jgi:hypothetical protein
MLSEKSVSFCRAQDDLGPGLFGESRTIDDLAHSRPSFKTAQTIESHDSGGHPNKVKDFG